MAFRIASLLGVGCLTQNVLGEEKEYFPLSGGIDTGVEVEIKVDGISDGEDSKIEFVDRTRKAAFRFVIDKANSKIIRESAAEFGNGDPESEGGFPAELSSGSATLVFTKRRHDISVSIGGVRFPWFDYSNRAKEGTGAPLLTHVAVFSGLQNPEVTLRRPACSFECHPNECLDSAGQSVCEAANGTACFSVTMSETPGVPSSCSSSQETAPGANQHCCDGSAAPPPARPLAEGDFARLTSNSDYLQRICNAFDVASCPTGEAGKLVKIAGSRVFIPSLLTQRTDPTKDSTLPENTYSALPRFAYYNTFRVNKKIVEINGDTVIDTGSGFQIDETYDIVTQAHNALVKDAGLEAGWYGSFLKFTRSGGTYERTVRITLDSERLFKGATGLRQIFVSDSPVDVEQVGCTDLDMVDEGDRTCADYAEKGLCDKRGLATAAGCEEFGSTSCPAKLPRGTNPKENGADSTDTISSAASLACCACGGGEIELPTDWGTSDTKRLLFK